MKNIIFGHLDAYVAQQIMKEQFSFHDFPETAAYPEEVSSKKTAKAKLAPRGLSGNLSWNIFSSKPAKQVEDCQAC